MNVFELRERLISDYSSDSSAIRSFIGIRDKRVDSSAGGIRFSDCFRGQSLRLPDPSRSPSSDGCGAHPSSLGEPNDRE